LAGSSVNATTATVTTTAGLAVGASVTGGGFPVGTTITAITGATTFTTSLPAAIAAGVTLSVTNPASAAAQTLNFNFAGTSQFGSIFGVNTLSQDGYTSGRMTGFNTGADGVISGRYSNGQTKTLGQVVLSNFNNPQGLQSLGGNNWAETSTSGTPLTGVPGSASLGVLQTSAVEDSNVDLTAELVNMITAQRVYQANAQTIKTQDAVLQTLVSLR
jgi:flagellar hook protein FlgE